MKMSTAASKALEESIAHWERVVADPLNEPTGRKACALCQKYSGCFLCPVRARSKKCICAGTPYEIFAETKCATLQSFNRTKKPPSVKVLKRLFALADDELQFLISLKEKELETSEESSECWSGCEDSDCPYTHPRS